MTSQNITKCQGKLIKNHYLEKLLFYEALYANQLLGKGFFIHFLDEIPLRTRVKLQSILGVCVAEGKRFPKVYLWTPLSINKCLP